jgi:hypothetical protein
MATTAIVIFSIFWKLFITRSGSVAREKTKEIDNDNCQDWKSFISLLLFL